MLDTTTYEPIWHTNGATNYNCIHNFRLLPDCIFFLTVKHKLPEKLGRSLCWYSSHWLLAGAANRAACQGFYHQPASCSMSTMGSSRWNTDATEWKGVKSARTSNAVSDQILQNKGTACVKQSQTFNINTQIIGKMQSWDSNITNLEHLPVY